MSAAGKGDYEVKAGDCLESIAAKMGLFWKKIWDDSANAELKEKRKSPNDLLPGDKLTIPDKEEHEASGAAKQRHTFRRKGVPSMLRLRFQDENGDPLAGEAYRLDVEGQLFTGDLDDAGGLEVEIPPDATDGEIRIGKGEDEMVFPLMLGHLDPADEVSGAQGRLKNLGYDCGPADGELNPQTEEALRQFQRDNGLEETGEADEDTCGKLEKLHDDK